MPIFLVIIACALVIHRMWKESGKRGVLMGMGALLMGVILMAAMLVACGDIQHIGV
jgi:hypothetical protein